MSKSIVSQLADLYRAEREKADASPDSHEAMIHRVTWAGTQEEQDYIEERRENAFTEAHRQTADWEAGGGRRQQGSRASASDPGQEDLAQRMEQEYRERYGVLPSDDIVKQAAQGFYPEDMQSEHGRELLYQRAAQLAGHKRAEPGPDAVAFGGSGGSSVKLGPQATGVEDLNRAWMAELNKGAR